MCFAEGDAARHGGTNGRGDAVGEENEIDSATPKVTTDQLVVVSRRVRQIVLR